MIDLLFKVGLPVFMIGVVTLASHRYGPAVGGILGAVPSKAGPVLLILAIEQGPSFAAASAAAAIGGAGGCGAFCLVYARVCRHLSWPIAGTVSYVAFVATWAVMLPISSIGPGAALVATIAILMISRRLLPKALPIPGRRATVANDLVVRMFAGASMVVFISTVGPSLGSTLSGMLTTLPTVAAVLALFTQAQEGPDRTIGVMRGMAEGLIGFTFFVSVLAVTLEPLGVAAAFVLATAVLVAVESIELRLALRAHRSAFQEEAFAPPRAVE